MIPGWHLGLHALGEDHPHAELGEFHPQLRDLYVAGGDVGFWQAAIRNRDDPEYAGLVETVTARPIFGVEVLRTHGEPPRSRPKGGYSMTVM